MPNTWRKTFHNTAGRTHSWYASCNAWRISITYIFRALLNLKCFKYWSIFNWNADCPYWLFDGGSGFVMLQILKQMQVLLTQCWVVEVGEALEKPSVICFKRNGATCFCLTRASINWTINVPWFGHWLIRFQWEKTYLTSEIQLRKQQQEAKWIQVNAFCFHTL